MVEVMTWVTVKGQWPTLCRYEKEEKTNVVFVCLFFLHVLDCAEGMC